MHILLIEDDLDLGHSLQKSLKLEYISSEWVRRATDAQSFVRQREFDCVLLDLSLPDGSGIELLHTWRSSGFSVPIIIITAQSTLETRLAGLNGGADDFILKPFAPAELIARIHAILRRHARQTHAIWTLGDIEIEPRTRGVKLRGQPIELSPREFSILLELAREGGAVVSKNTLAERLQPLGDPVDFSTIEVHISNLRRKIGADLIKTIRGVGYLIKMDKLP